MLELLLGRDWTANTDEILSRISQDVREERSHRILLVPELISHEMERHLCAAAGDTASRFAQVLSFTRLARRVADLVGCAAEKCLDDGGRVVAMAAAVRQLHSRLKAYAAVETRPEFLIQLVDAVDEMKRCCIRSEDLKRAAAATQGVLAQKLEELALILDAYDGICMRGKRDPRDQMTLLLEQMEEVSFGAEETFYIDGFPDFSRQHLAILEHLIRVSPKVVVSLNCDRPNSALLAFEQAGETAAELIACARRLGVEVRVSTVQEHETQLRDAWNVLFQGTLPPMPALKARLCLLRPESPYQECLMVAQKIHALIVRGFRYRDIAVVCGNPETYRADLSLIFHSCGIPLYLAGTEDVLQEAVSETVLAALEAALGGFEQRAVLHYLRTALSPLDPERCDLLENYAVIWGISGARWKQPWTAHPDGLSGKWDDAAQSALADLNDARTMAIAPLERLSQGLRQARNLGEQVQALYAFLEENAMAERLQSLAEEMERDGERRGAQILNQLWEILITALEQLYDVLGGEGWDAQTFCRLLELLLGQYSVGTIPPVLDAVTAGSVAAMQCHRQRVLFVLGAKDGDLPAYHASAGVLTDQERAELRQMGVPLLGGALDGMQTEFARIYGVFCGTSEMVWVSCPASEQPSFLYSRLLELAGGQAEPEKLLGAALFSADAAAACLAGHGAADAAAALGLQEEYARYRKKLDYRIGTVSASGVKRLYGMQLTLSASQIDSQAECRMAYFLKYGLRVRERKEATVDPAEFGTYVHAVLEETAREIGRRGGFRAVDLEQTVEISRDCARAYASQHFGELDSSRVAYLLRRNDRELELVVRELWRELHQAQFEPVDYELRFGNDGKMPAICLPGSQIDARIEGVVDRIDAWHSTNGTYFRVVDYKTGEKSFDYCDVFHGVGLQMLLYLFALERGGGKILGEAPIPAGVQYFPARVPYVSVDGASQDGMQERRKLWTRKGLLLHNADVLAAMDPSEDMETLCCTRRKDETLTGELATPAQMRQLETFVFRLLRHMVDEIASGSVAPNPYTRGTAHDACRFCPYGPICGGQEQNGRRNYKAMGAEAFWEGIDQEVKRNG